MVKENSKDQGFGDLIRFFINFFVNHFFHLILLNAHRFLLSHYYNFKKSINFTIAF